MVRQTVELRGTSSRWKFERLPFAELLDTVSPTAMSTDVAFYKWRKKRTGRNGHDAGWTRKYPFAVHKAGARFDLYFSCSGGLGPQVSWHRAIYWAFKTAGPRTPQAFRSWAGKLAADGFEINHRAKRRWMNTLANLRRRGQSDNRADY